MMYHKVHEPFVLYKSSTVVALKRDRCMNAKHGPSARLGPIRQLGYVVENLDHAVQAWSAALGIGPWTIIRNVPLHSIYCGRSSQPLIDIALGYSGEMQIELIKQNNHAPSPYRPFIERGQYGLHHTAYV